MKRLLAGFAVVATLAFPAFAQDQAAPLPSFGASTTIPIPPAMMPPATQNTITTSGPVSSNTTISTGTLAGSFLAWIMVAFSGPIGGMAVWIMVRVLKNLGITATDALRARMTEFVVNGLNTSAPIIQAQMAGRGQVEIKNAIVANAVSYVQAHGANTIKKLGLDPNSGAAVEAIKARIESAIADPNVATPAILDPAAAPKPA